MEAQSTSNNLQDTVEDIFRRTSALREVTYKYIPLGDDFHFNETVFIDYGELDSAFRNEEELSAYLKKNESFSKVKDKVNAKLTADIKTLKNYLNDCQDAERPQIEQQIAALEFTENGLDFELEKAGYESCMSSEEIRSKIQIQEDLDKKMFGEHVANNPDFILEGYAFTQDLLEKNGHNLSSKQQEVLQKSQEDMLGQVALLKQIPIEDIEIPVFHPPIKDSQFEELKGIKISREDYMKIFDIFFEISNVPQRSELGNYSSFYDGDDAYGVPESDSYAERDLEYLLRIGAHETSHYVNLKATRERGDGKQVGDMLKEEGVSMITEALVSGVNIEDMSYMTLAGPSVIMNKLYDGESYLRYQDAYLELLEKSGKSAKGDVVSKTLRKKRGFHKSFSGGTNKDSAYALGMQGVLGYIRSGEGGIENLFGGKISLDQMRSGEYKPDNFGNSHIQHILLSELIFFYLKKNGFADGDFHESFISYVKEKYKNFAHSFDLFNEAERFCFENKRKVVEILRIIDSASQRRERENENENETSQNL